jgi:hypothetical protein
MLSCPAISSRVNSPASTRRTTSSAAIPCVTSKKPCERAPVRHCRATDETRGKPLHVNVMDAGLDQALVLFSLLTK